MREMVRLRESGQYIYDMTACFCFELREIAYLITCDSVSGIVQF